MWRSLRKQKKTVSSMLMPQFINNYKYSLGNLSFMMVIEIYLFMKLFHPVEDAFTQLLTYCKYCLIESKLICNTVPISIQKNVAFVVDTSRLEHPSDVLADDMGVWKHDGVDTGCFEVSLSSSEIQVEKSHICFWSLLHS